MDVEARSPGPSRASGESHKLYTTRQAKSSATETKCACCSSSAQCSSRCRLGRRWRASGHVLSAVCALVAVRERRHIVHCLQGVSQSSAEDQHVRTRYRTATTAGGQRWFWVLAEVPGSQAIIRQDRRKTGGRACGWCALRGMRECACGAGWWDSFWCWAWQLVNLLDGPDVPPVCLRFRSCCLVWCAWPPSLVELAAPC